MRVAAIALIVASTASAQTVTHHDAAGQPVRVTVRAEDCPSAPRRGCAIGTVVYLGGNDRRLKHELAHIAGMQHSAWRKSS